MSKINVTKPFLPPLPEYLTVVQEIWDRGWLTNDGPLVRELEGKLLGYLKVNHLLFLANGTLGLQIAIRALNLKGSIITTPFSFVATSSSIVWENCKPVFVDIKRESFNIDPELIEGAIDSTTVAILATHVFGNPCEIDKIERIAQKYNLKVIYDAAHCFGTKYKGNSVFQYGDISVASFHATKLFHTIEGGAVVTSSLELREKLGRLRNFGFAGYESFKGIGINAKNSEFHAGMGIVNLQYIESILDTRKKQYLRYLKNFSSVNLKFQEINPDSTYNYAYFPVVFNEEYKLDNVKFNLESREIYPRRYFFPSLSTLDYVSPCHVPNADYISNNILCLPLFHDLKFAQIDEISEIILKTR